MLTPELLSDQPLLVRDAVELPSDAGQSVQGRASRTDAYPIVVTRRVEDTIDRVAELVGDAKVALITDQTVLGLHGASFVEGLRRAGIDVVVAAIPPGETSKSLVQATGLWDWLADSSIARRDVIVTFGGGVINDTGGWVASGYMRGLPYINVPTTLMAQVDGAIGGKVAVNHPLAKNLLGAFYQPLGVISNVSFLETLDKRHISAGVAECIKKAVIASPEYWAFLDAEIERIVAKELEALERLVGCAGAIKASLLEPDPYENDLRRPLNFGHTIGHPLETVTGYGPLLHGEAVAFGMVVETRIAARRRLFDHDLLERLIELLRRAALPTDAADLPVRPDGDAILQAMEKVRQIRAGSLRFVLPVQVGTTLIADDVAPQEVRQALRDSGVDFGPDDDRSPAESPAPSPTA